LEWSPRVDSRRSFDDADDIAAGSLKDDPRHSVAAYAFARLAQGLEGCSHLMVRNVCWPSAQCSARVRIIPVARRDAFARYRSQDRRRCNAVLAPTAIANGSRTVTRRVAARDDAKAVVSGGMRPLTVTALYARGSPLPPLVQRVVTRGD
jgi:hypothetical protein